MSGDRKYGDKRMDRDALDRFGELLNLPPGEQPTAEHLECVNPGSLREHWLELARHYQILARENHVQK